MPRAPEVVESIPKPSRCWWEHDANFCCALLDGSRAAAALWLAGSVTHRVEVQRRNVVVEVAKAVVCKAFCGRLIAPRALATSGRRPGVRAKRAARGVAGHQLLDRHTRETAVP